MGLKSLHVSTVGVSQVATEIRRTLAGSPTRIVANPADAAAILRILGESRDKQVATITGTGRVYEFELRLEVRFDVIVPGREVPLIPPSVVATRRPITYSETAPIAKEAEEQLLFKDMQAELAGRILRQLAVARKDL